MLYKLERENLYKCGHVDIHISHTHQGKYGYYIHFSPCIFKNKGSYATREYPCVSDSTYSYKMMIYHKYRKNKKTEECLQKILDMNIDKVLKLYAHTKRKELFALLNEMYYGYLANGDNK